MDRQLQGDRLVRYFGDRDRYFRGLSALVSQEEDKLRVIQPQFAIVLLILDLAGMKLNKPGLIGEDFSFPPSNRLSK